MVSVVIPTYNRAGFVKEAVESVLAQKVPAGEVIVVDDGSTDGTDRLLESFGDRIRYLPRARGGVSAARNLGIRNSRYEWIAFLDSDDLWLPLKLKLQIDFLASHPGIEICQTGEIWVRNGERLNPKKYHRKPQGHCFTRLLDRCLVSPSAVIVHRDVFDAVGMFDESLPACEDYDLWLRIGCRYPIGLEEEPLVIKRGGHPDQLSTTVPTLDRYRIRALAALLRSGCLDEVRRKAAFDVLAGKCRIYGEGCRKRGKVDEAEAVLALPGAIAAELGFILICVQDDSLSIPQKSGGMIPPHPSGFRPTR